MTELGVMSLMVLGTLAVTFYFLMIRLDSLFKRVDELDYKLETLHGKLNTVQAQIADLHVAEHVQLDITESVNEFDTRIEAIKNELGLRFKSADVHVKHEAEVLHPNVYNIDEQEHDKYTRAQEIEIAR